jgi:hypothetical protein
MAEIKREGQNMCSSVASTLMAAILWGNVPRAGEPGKAELTPDLCKKALLEMMQSKPGRALGFFDKELVDDMAKMEVEKKKDEYRWTGAYRFDPKKATYVLFVSLVDDRPPLRPHPKGYLLHLKVYEGSFAMKEGRWVATVPRYKYTLAD